MDKEWKDGRKAGSQIEGVRTIGRDAMLTKGVWDE